MAKNDPGPGVDAQGQPVVDPTENVKALTEAAVQRLDDLREAEARFNEAEIRHVNELAALRSTYEEQLRIKESERIDAIRAVDIGAVQRAQEVAAAQADAIRNQLAVTANAAQTGLDAALEPMRKDIADLRRAQYEQAGQKAQVVETRQATGASSALIFGAIAAGSTIIGLLITLAVIIASSP